MRKRSQTIQADSFEEFVELSIAQGPDMNSNSPYISESPYCSPPKYHQKYDQPLLEVDDDSFEEELNQVPCLDNFTDFCSPTDAYDGTTTPGTDSTGYTSRTLSAGSTSECDGWSPFYVKAGKTRVVKVMAIGQAGTGKHCLVDTVFGEEAQKKMGFTSPFDLVIKHQEQEGCSSTFKFWLRDPTDEKNEPLVKVYYRSINQYIFVYKVNDARSFACLDKAIERVKSDVGEDKFKGILLANIPDGPTCERQVAYEEGLRLKQKYKLSQFLEIKYSSSALEKVVFEFINSKDKLKN